MLLKGLTASQTGSMPADLGAPQSRDPTALDIDEILKLPMVLAEWLGASRYPRLICDSRLKLLWHCPKLPSFIANDNMVRIERGLVVLADKRAHAELGTFTMRPETDDTAISWVPGGHGNLVVLQCKRLALPDGTLAFGLQIVTASDVSDSGFRHFERHFRMTRQEATICTLLLQGQTVQAIASAEGKSPDTIRFHVRNIYQKVEVSSREALFYKMLPFLFD